MGCVFISCIYYVCLDHVLTTTSNAGIKSFSEQCLACTATPYYYLCLDHIGLVQPQPIIASVWTVYTCRACTVTPYHYLCLDHIGPVQSHFPHYAIDVNSIMFTDHLQQAIQSDERSRTTNTSTGVVERRSNVWISSL